MCIHPLDWLPHWQLNCLPVNFIHKDKDMTKRRKDVVASYDALSGMWHHLNAVKWKVLWGVAKDKKNQIDELANIRLQQVQLWLQLTRCPRLGVTECMPLPRFKALQNTSSFESSIKICAFVAGFSVVASSETKSRPWCHCKLRRVTSFDLLCSDDSCRTYKWKIFQKPLNNKYSKLAWNTKAYYCKIRFSMNSSW